ncbi:MAG: hypothetical protein M3545_00950 [Acidobacteriota bacterium]|nr:hypothetical protein [Acidobacteriota bacterium]
MSVERPVPSSRRPRAPLRVALGAVLLVVTAAGAYVAGRRSGAVHEVLMARPAEAERVAFVLEEPCADQTCQTLWLGNSREDAVKVASLPAATERCEEIAWAKDGLRVAFVVNGYQLRIFDGYTRKLVREVNAIEPEGTPTTRFVRGVTFSENGAAVTFDECPRGRSGCKSGLVAVR